MSQESSRMFGGDEPLCLCLSGGGFRATCFHLGVVRLLKEVNCLKRITHVFSVSGGSVLAAHLALNWAAYSEGDAAKFQDLSDAVVRFIARDVRGRIVRRWLLFRPRAAALQREYDAFYKGARLRELPLTPAFHFATTSMTTGRLCAFTREGFRVAREDGRVRLHPAEAQPVAQAVAASSAFPPLFPPLRLDLPDLSRAEFPTAEYLTDGGVFDNVGLACFRRMTSPGAIGAFDRVLVSDASGFFDHAPDVGYRLLTSRTARTTDILMQREAELEAETWKRELGERLVLFRISDVVDDLPLLDTWFRAQSPKAQRLLKNVRTDFDPFPHDLTRALVRHGYEVAFLRAFASALSCPLDAYVAAAARRLPATLEGGLRPWDPMPPGWPDRAAMSHEATSAAIREHLVKLYEALAAADRVLHREPEPARSDIRDQLAAEERDQLKQLETLLLNSSARPVGLWNPRDWTSWMLLALVTSMLVLGAVAVLST